MVYEHKNGAAVKTIPMSAITTITGQDVNKHGIVLVGERAGVVFDKIGDDLVSVNFDTQAEFMTSHFDESSLPKIGEKIYAAAADGKLTKTAGGNKLVGWYWGKSGSSVVFSLHA